MDSDGLRDSSRELDRIVAEYADRLNAGETVQPEDILAEHPTLCGDILDQLEAFISVGRPVASNTPLGTLGDYTLRRQIGRGGMGVVYDAWQGTLDRQVALKVLPAGIAVDDKAFLRFMREAKTAAKLNHQNVVSVYGMGVEQNTPYYSLEFVEGETLAQVLVKIKEAEPGSETSFGKKDCVEYFAKLAAAFADVADGLQHAHSKSVIHRDIKPSNLILDQEGRLRILDFGLARLEGQESLTISGDLVGTPLYMSPEQARRKKVQVDHRTDVYSLGATIYEALCGQPPFRGKDHQDTLSQIIERDPVSPWKVNARVPKELEIIVLECLRKDPGDRYGTAEALAQDLRRFVRGDPVEARPQPQWAKALRWIHRRRTAVAITAILVFAVVVSALLLWKDTLESWQERQADYERLINAGAIELQASLLTTRVDAVSSLAFDQHRQLFLPSSDATPEMEDTRVAVSTLTRAVELIPSAADAYYHRARALLLLGNEVAAIEDLDHCLELKPEFLPALTLLATIRKRNGPGQIPSAPTTANTGYHDAWLAVHRSMAEGRWKEAADAYDQLLHQERANEAPYLGVAVELRLGRGLARLMSSDLHGAVRDFSAAYDRWFPAPEPAFLLGKAYLMMEEEQAAENVFVEAFDSAPPDEKDRVLVAILSLYRQHEQSEKALSWVKKISDGYRRKRCQAILLVDRRRPKDAREIALKALADPGHPEDSYMCMVVGNTFAMQRNRDEAREWIEKAQKYDPENAYVVNVLGQLHEQAGELEKAIESFNKAVKLNPHFAGPLYNLGVLFDSQGKLSEAEAKYREANKVAYLSVTKVKARPIIIERLLRNLIRQGRFEDAVTEAQRALELLPHATAIHERLADALLNQGKSVDAFAVFAQSVARSPGSDGCTKLIRLHNRIENEEDSLGPLWDGIVEALEGRTVRELVARPWVMTTLGLGYLNGERRKDTKRARRLIEHAVEASVGRGTLALTALARIQMADEQWGEAVLTLEKLLRLPLADHTLEDELAECRMKALPDIVSRRSVSALLRDRPPDPKADGELLEGFRAVATDTAARSRVLWLEGLVLWRAGKYEEAARVFRELIGAGTGGYGNILYLAKALRSDGKREDAERTLRMAVETRPGHAEEIWYEWFDLALSSPGRSPAVVLEHFPADRDATGPAADIRWLLEQIRDGNSVRLNCGGREYIDGKGRVWGEDRFFLGGLSGGWPCEQIDGTKDDVLYRRGRFFMEENVAGYRIPLPRGQYLVTLHFAETYFQAPNCRRFDVAIEGETLPETFEPFTAGFAVAQSRAYPVELRDGMLEISFIFRREYPEIRAIEIERLD